MTNNYAQVLKRVAWTLIVAGLPAGTTLAAGKNCADLAALPAVVEVGEGMQTAMRSPEAITRLAIGDPKIADVHLNGNDAYLLTGIAPGTTSLMVWTACSSAPRQSMVFVKGKATSSLGSAVFPEGNEVLTSQVQTDIRFVEVSRTKLKEASTSIFGKGGSFLFGSPGTVPGVTVTPGQIGSLAPNIPLDNGSFNIGIGGGNVLGLINALVYPGPPQPGGAEWAERELPGRW